MEPPESEDHFDRVNELFSDALNLPTGERHAFVSRHVGEDSRLRDSVIRMLEQFDRIDGFLTEPVGKLGGSAYELRAGELIGSQFRIMGALGRGGMGEVYRAEDLQMRDVVALKIIRAEWRGREEVLDRFRAEIRLTRRITHPNVCPVYEPHSGVLANGQAVDFYTMKYLDGDTLADRISLGALPIPDLLRIAQGIAAGLDAAHSEGIVHRDLKPQNIILAQTRDRAEWPVITDFGLASLDAGPSEETSLTQICGSPYYMAPEQFSNDRVTAATDIYAFALILFEMAAGQRPFPDQSLTALALRRALKDAPRIGTLAPDLPTHWERVFAEALSRNPGRRPKTAGELVSRLEQAPRWPGGFRVPQFPKPTRRVVLIAGILVGGVSVFEGVRRYTDRGALIPDAPTLMLTNFTHSSEAHDGEIARALDTLLEKQLLQSAHVGLVRRSGIDDTVKRLEAAGRSKVDLGNPRTAREVALRQGASFILFGSLGRAGDEYTIHSRLELLANSPEEAREHWDFDRAFRDDELSSLSSAVSRISYLLRRQLGETQGEWELHSSTPEQLTTASWAALKKYIEANEQWRRGNEPEALDDLRSALSIDPEFTSARSRLADLLMATGDRDASLASYRLAVASLDRKHLDDRESYRIRGSFFLDTGQLDRAAITLRRFRQNYPRDAVAYFLEAGVVRRLGQRDYSEKLLREAIRLDPGSYAYAFWLAIYDLENGDLPRAEKQCARASTLQKSFWTDQLRAAIAFGRGQLAEAAQELDRVRAIPESASEGSQLKACLCAEQGQWEAAAQEARAGVTKLRGEGASRQDIFNLRLLLANVLLQQGRAAESIRECDALLSENLENLAILRVGCLLARGRAAAKARRCLRECPEWPVYLHWTMRLRGEMELAAGHSAAALRWMKEAPASSIPNVWPEYLVRAAIAAGDKDTARKHIDELLENPGRFFFQAHHTGPGFIRWAVECAVENPGLASHPTQLRALQATLFGITDSLRRT